MKTGLLGLVFGICLIGFGQVVQKAFDTNKRVCYRGNFGQTFILKEPGVYSDLVENIETKEVFVRSHDVSPANPLSIDCKFLGVK